MCLLDGRRPLITWKPTCIYSRRNTRDCLLFRELKYEVVYATKVVGEHSHPNLRGWEGSQTIETGKTLLTGETVST